MKKGLLIFILCLFTISCGVKDDPEYRSQNNYKKIINLV